MDITFSYAVDDGGGDLQTRHLIRQWILTGRIESAQQTAARQTIDGHTIETGRTPDQVPSIEIARGIKVSPEQMRLFEQMGGSMVQKPPRRMRQASEPDGVT